MTISPFFKHLRTSYQAELDDLTSDSEGKDVLKKRLAEKRKELDFLKQMIELSPEMVAVVFHDAFKVKLPAVLDDLLSFDSEELPEWSSLSDVVQLADWAQPAAKVILAEPQGEWFMTVAAALEYMFHKKTHRPAQHDDDEKDDENEDHDGGADYDSEHDREEYKEAKAREEAGQDWMVEQGFDRKE
ncbi:MAG: hypothetical protein V9E91_01545 [Burkholderiaceae bacterium]|jgi:hypothetical protein|nr:hypothetical protein [Polaromonas sp.]